MFILASFLSKCYAENNVHIPFLVQQLIDDIIDRMLESTKIPEPPLSHYLPPQDEHDINMILNFKETCIASS